MLVRNNVGKMNISWKNFGIDSKGLPDRKKKLNLCHIIKSVH